MESYKSQNSEGERSPNEHMISYAADLTERANIDPTSLTEDDWMNLIRFRYAKGGVLKSIINERNEISKRYKESSQEDKERSDQLNEIIYSKYGIDDYLQHVSPEKLRQLASEILHVEVREIAWEPEEISEETKVYIGELFDGIFNLGLEEIFTSFPEGKVETKTILMNREKIEKVKENYQFTYDDGDEFNIDPEILDNELNFARLRLVDLGLVNDKNKGFSCFSTEEVNKKINELGLAACPPEVVMYYSGEIGPDESERFSKKGYFWNIQFTWPEFDGAYGETLLMGSSGDYSTLETHLDPSDKSGWRNDAQYIFRVIKSKA